MTLSTPHAVMARLEEIERELAMRQNELEKHGREWFKMKPHRAKVHAMALARASGTVEDKKAAATLASCDIGAEDEGMYELQWRIIGTLETRATIGAAILKAQGRS